MIDPFLPRYIDDSELSPSDEISLNCELLRLIEKDIESAVSQNIIHGWTTWTIIGAVVGVMYVLFSTTKNLAEIPADVVIVFVTSIPLLYLLIGTYGLLTGSGVVSKEGRLSSAPSMLHGKEVWLIIRTIGALVFTYFILNLGYPWFIMVAAIIGIWLPLAIPIVSMALLAIFKFPLGNNSKSNTYARGFLLFFLVFWLILTILLGSKLPFPVGEMAVNAYLIGGALAVLLILIELFFTVSTPPYSIKQLQDLRYDITFRRVELNEAIAKYQVIVEGRAVADEVRTELSSIVQNLNRQTQLHQQQTDALTAIDQALAGENRANVADEKKNQIRVLVNAFETLAYERNNLINAIKREFGPFQLRLQKASQASGDFNSQERILESMNDMTIRLDNGNNWVNMEKSRIFEQITFEI